MHTRAEIMRDAGVLECPNWCTQDDDEAELQQHIGNWANIIENGGTDGTANIRCRPRRNWHHEDGTAGNGQGFVEVDFQTDAGGVPEWFRSGEVQALLDDLENVDWQANEPAGWVRAYDGAEEDAAELDAVGV